MPIIFRGVLIKIEVGIEIIKKYKNDFLAEIKAIEITSFDKEV
jgi:hypothetical protein